MQKTELKKGDVVQLSPETTANVMFRGCMLTVSKVREWGVQGYVQSLGKDGQTGGQAYYRSKWEDMELVGHAAWDFE